MTHESLSVSSPAGVAPVEAAVSPPAVVERRKPRLDPRYIAPLLITCILLLAHLTVGILENPIFTGLAIGAAIGLEIVLGRVFTGKWPHLASAYISGISVGILIRSPYFWPFALCSAISIASKYVLRVKDRHIWNPSNFGIVMMLLLAPSAVATLSVQFDNRIWAMAVIWCLGSFIISRLKRFHICLTYVLSFLAFGVVRSLVTGHEYVAEIAPITGPMYQLFTFFMITDPKTTVKSKKGQIIVVFLVALVEAVLRLTSTEHLAWMTEWVRTVGHDPQVFAIHAPYFALFLVGPIANLTEMWQESRKKAKALPAAA